MQAQHLEPNRAAAAQLDVVALGDALQLRGVRMRFERNEEVFGEGEPAEHVYYVLSGGVRALRFTGDGRRQILGFYLPGDVFGLEAGAMHSLSAEALSASEIVMVRRSLLEKTAQESPAAGRSLLKLAADALAAARDQAMMLGRKSANERVAAFLLQLAQRRRSKADLELPMSRADIGDYLGLTIESVSRAFSDMERQHAIALPSSRHVVMTSRAALTELEAA